MKIPRVIISFLLGFFFSQVVFAQDSVMLNRPDPELELRDTTIAMDPAFIVKDNYAVRDSLNALKVWASKMHDTTIVADPSFIVFDVYAESDSLANLYGGFASRRDSLIHALRDSLSAIGSALLRTAEMQDTTIVVDPAFVVQDVYINRDRLDAANDSLRAILIQAATMQDTIIVLVPEFKVFERYAKQDQYNAFHDSVWASLAQAAVMQDTVVMIDPAFFVRNVYEKKDRQDAERDSLMWPTIMRDTLIVIDSSFVVQDLYPRKDYMDSVREFQIAYADSVYSDSVNRHWAGWKKYEVQPDHAFTLNSQKILKGRTKSSLKYNIADFYLFLNGDPVKPDNPEYNFFAAGCLAFKYDDTLLLNSGLGFKVGVGVGIKIIQGKFTSSLHANKRNEEIYKDSQDDSVYKKSIIVEPNNQSLTLQFDPSYQSNEIITGEYQATYKKFYQKNEDGQDEVLHYSVRIVFICRVTGGLDTIKSLR
jgi:hypothetical protein